MYLYQQFNTIFPAGRFVCLSPACNVHLQPRNAEIRITSHSRKIIGNMEMNTWGRSHLPTPILSSQKGTDSENGWPSNKFGN